MEMPPKVDGCPWLQKFTTATDGFSLNTMITKLSSLTGPVLILIQACNNEENKKLNGNSSRHSTFGAFLSEAPKRSKHFKGTGQTFVFKLKPNFRAYKWTGKDPYFFTINNDCLIIGSSNGSNAIRIDANLCQGRTRACGTFDNPPLLEGGEDFTLASLECWAFET